MNTISKRKITITPTSYVCPARKYPLWPNSPQVLPNNVIACSDAKGWSPPRVAVTGCPAHLYGEPEDPVREQTACIHEEVHHVRVVGVLHAAQAGLDHGEARLHEHDEKAADEGPDEIDRDLVLTDLVRHIWERYTNFESAAGTSLMVPVIVPPGSPLAKSAVAGALPAASFSSVSAGVSVGVGGAAAGGSGEPPVPAFEHAPSSPTQE